MCYTTQAAAEQMCKSMLHHNSRIKIEVNADSSFKGITVESTYLDHNAKHEQWIDQINEKLQTCARQNVLACDKT